MSCKQFGATLKTSRGCGQPLPAEGFGHQFSGSNAALDFSEQAIEAVPVADQHLLMQQAALQERHFRIDLTGPRIAGRGFLVPAQLMQHEAPAKPRFRHVRLQGQRLIAGQKRLVVTPEPG